MPNQGRICETLISPVNLVLSPLIVRGRIVSQTDAPSSLTLHCVPVSQKSRPLDYNLEFTVTLEVQRTTEPELELELKLHYQEVIINDSLYGVQTGDLEPRWIRPSQRICAVWPAFDTSDSHYTWPRPIECLWPRRDLKPIRVALLETDMRAACRDVCCADSGGICPLSV